MAETSTPSTPIFADTPPQAHPLMQRLVREHGAHWVDLATLPAWLAAAPGDAVILIAGDAVRFPEGLDVAVVLPELRTEACQAFRIGIATPADEDAIGQRYGAQRRPSLVFVRDGRYVTTVSGMHDWPDFLALVRNALASPTTHAPIAIQSAGAAASSCH